MREGNKLKLEVVGDQIMHCHGCEQTVEFTLGRVAGVRQVKADYKDQTIAILSDPAGIDLAELVAELEWIGYRVQPA